MGLAPFIASVQVPVASALFTRTKDWNCSLHTMDLNKSDIFKKPSLLLYCIHIKWESLSKRQVQARLLPTRVFLWRNIISELER